MRPGAETVLLCGAYQLDRSRSHPLLDDLPEVIHLPARLGHQPSLRAAVDLLCSELEQPRPGADITVPALLDVLLLLILRTWLHQRPPGQAATGWAAVLNDPAITAALRGIHGDLARPWTVQDLAAQAGLSRAAFARRFTALAGQPPLAYLTWWRLTTAARLLRHSDAPLSTVATQIGYTSEYAFANAFKREYGIAPGRYRRSFATESTSSTPTRTE
jgi:AraC-like DNA-binding protein